MQEEPREQRPAIHEEPVDEQAYPLTHSAACGGITIVTMGLIDVLAHLGPTGLLVGGLASYVAWRHGPELYDYVRQKFPAAPAPGDEQAEPAEEEPVYTGTRSIVDRLLGNYPAHPQSPETEDVQEEPSCTDMEEEDLTPPVSTAGFVFSSLLTSFRPTLQYIYLASLPDGTPICCQAKDLCHVALAGSTGNGKGVVIRLLMSQLCKVGASVLLLNPHYTRYDLETGEDWTPFTPYLVYDPMECRKMEVIEYYLKQVATELLPKRLERYAHSQPVGKPYFLVIDELPDIVGAVKNAPTYLAKILREGRKVGIFLISASQGFLIKTVFGQGGSDVRDCYRTAYYMGGDIKTALALLGIPSSQMPENTLGKGVVMLRTSATKRATLARVPYVDNAALYRLLGPSTYVPSTGNEYDDLFLEHLAPQSVAVLQRPVLQRAVPQAYGYGMRRLHTVPEPEPMEPIPVRQRVPLQSEPQQPVLSPQLQQALEEYRQGNRSFRDLGRALGINKDAAGRLIQELKARRLIGV
jgi:hypothetical protein